MYEFKNESGDLITVRSLRTLERLLFDEAIRKGTPFRAAGEDVFVPAYSHPVVKQLASQLSPTPLARPIAAAEIPLAPAPLAYPEVPTERAFTPPAPSPWRAQPSISVPTIDSASARVTNDTGGGLAARAFVWQLGALVCGVVAFGVVEAALHPVLGAIASFFATSIAAHAGERRMRRANPTAGSAPIFISALLFVALCALGGLGTFVGGAIAAVTLVVSWNKAPTRMP
jgi:hypothetical protein